MPVVVLPRPAFFRAVNERIEWLAANRSEEQLDDFLAALADVRKRIEQNPEAGPTLKTSSTHVLRMRLFHRPLPYLVYYGHPRARPVTEVYLVRLYGSGQRREDLDMSEWPW